MVPGIHLSPDELKTLPYETRPTGQANRNDMKLFDKGAVKMLALRKAEVMQMELPPPLPTFELGSFWDRVRPAKPPVQILDYVPPKYARADPPAETIVWKGELVQCPVSPQDACTLYGVRLQTPRCMPPTASSLQHFVQLFPNDIEDLAEKSNWLDIGTVARRALTVHGGFIKHNERYVSITCRVPAY